MAIAVHRSQHRVIHRPAWVRRRGAEPDTVLAGLMLTLLLGGVVVLVAALDISVSTRPIPPGSWFSRTTTSRPVEGATVTASTLSETPSGVPLSAPSTTEDEGAVGAEVTVGASVLTVGSVARVAHTEGLGVVLHAAPTSSARLPAGFLEGARVTVIEMAGPDWARVQSETRRTGWVPAAFLAASE